jgi:membrane protease YdiL (CAAX protease family)
MHASRRSGWDFFAAVSFILAACFVCWALSFAASFGPNFTITIRPLQWAVNTKFILLTAATFLPALCCFVVYPEVLSSLKKVNANWKVYLVAVVTGLSLPLLSYPGSHYYDFPWGREVAIHLGRVFAWNLFMAPFWEEIVWRGCFLKRIRSFCSAPTAILLMSVGWTIWHGGYIAFLYSGGIPVEALRILPLTYFCVGIILGSVFEMSRGSIWPCVLMHTSLNSATVIYYTPHNRAYEVSSYMSELIFAAILAAIFLWFAMRRTPRFDFELSRGCE